VRLVDRTALPTRDAILDRTAFMRMIALNRDILVRSFALLFAFAVFTSRSAAAGDIVLAANEILMNLVVLAAYFLDGLAAAAEQLAGRAIGARFRPAFDRVVRLTIGWGYAVAIFLSLLLLLCGGAAVDLMTTSQPVRSAARGVLVWAALFPAAGTLAYQMDGIFIGATWSTDMRNAMLASVAVYLVAGMLLGTWFGIVGWWMALLIFLLVRGFSLLWLERLRVRSAF
jgi:MATE family multidrug resistance protein